MNNTDLHTHTCCSDGGLSPSEVVRLAKQKGIKNLAITDHNSVDGIEEACKEGKKLGVYIIPAIEINAREDEVLGYFVDYKNRDFKKEIKKIQEKSIVRIKKIIIKLNNKGIKVSFRDLIKLYYPNRNFVEGHLINYLKLQGLWDSNYLWLRYISKEGETYVPPKEISIFDAVRLIKKYGGVPVLPHPWKSQSSKSLLKEESIRKLIEAGLRGLEIDNGDRNGRRDDKTVIRIKELAKKYSLIITSGSDFHDNIPVRGHRLGDYNCDEKIVVQLKHFTPN